MTPGYQALLEKRAYVDHAVKGRIRVTGEDRARLIHALTTNHVQGMRPGDTRYAFFLTAQGRIIGDVLIRCEAEHLLLEVEAEVRDTIVKHIDHYIIADDVTIEDVTESTYSLATPAAWLVGPIENKAAAIATLDQVEAAPEDAEAFRIHQFHPRFGPDFNNNTLPQETGLSNALHFQKGCYLGQEIVERIRSRGHVNKMLLGLRMPPNASVHVGDTVTWNAVDAGQITSVNTISGLQTSAIAMVRLQGGAPAATLQVCNLTAEVHGVSSAHPMGC